MTTKRQLEKLSKIKEQELDAAVKEVADKVKSNVSNALIISGSIALGYFIFKSLFESQQESKKSKKKPAKIKSRSRIGLLASRLTNEAAILLLSLAKEKIQEYIDSKNEDTSGNSKPQ